MTYLCKSTEMFLRSEVCAGIEAFQRENAPALKRLQRSAYCRTV